MTPDVLNFAVRWKALGDEAYTAQKSKIAKIRERCARRNRIKHGEISAAQTALGGIQLAYRIYKGINGPSALPPTPIDHEVTAPKVGGRTKGTFSG